ncbi:myelin-associated glycoprotein-like isoform X1 [Chiloscyllium plagiosum]|uniref:myelin-associated glycoprotein-like isoform X1 n=1 Tax=Chiloscyllium plagiosum TaxID=36176 RepID=UPI001CB7FB03|nr:myelin-associated glycoprotein-like isoform X1 [Chiloscyllium plagiosum]XP_043559940.1 myelin-associated glycoprotein-like isoform X1 [Chiloscyllium plagiosum]
MTTSHWTLALIVLCLIQGCSSMNGWGVSVPGSLSALQGSSVTFKCSFRYPDRPQPAHKIIAVWLKDPCLDGSEELYNSDNPNQDPGIEWIGNLGQKNCSLRIKDVQKKHNHIFCFRFRIVGKDNWTGKPGLQLIVYARPRTPVISPSELVEGVTTNLKCSSSNIDEKTKTSLNWYGLPDQSAEQCSDDPTVLSSCLRFIPSYQDHNKIIKCSVTYSAFAYSDKASITLNVSYTPKNVTIRVDKGSGLTIREGDKLSLMCTSNSNPEAMYSWHKREEESGETRLINGSKGTLSFQSITSSDSGFYSCTAANHVGSNKSETLEIQVQYAPKNVTIRVDKGSGLTIREGDKLSLMCTSNSNPEAMYSWHKREEESGETRLINGSKGTLSFQSITSSDSGFYSCTAANHVGSSKSKTLEIQVQYAPKNVTIQVVHGSHLEIIEGDTLSLMCTSNSNPEATYTLYKREESNDQTRALSNVKGTLTFQHISRTDSGFYSCTATNYIGNVTSNDLEIYVQYKPVEVNVSRVGMSFSCMAKANPLAQITWNYTGNIKPVITGNLTTSTLTLRTMSRICVSCQARNKHGLVHSNEQCTNVKELSASILKFAIAGSLVGIGLVLAAVLWIRRKDLFKGKKSENNSQREMLDLQQGNETTIPNSDIIYDSTWINKSQRDAPSMKPADTLVYASIQFNNKSKGSDSENPQLGQIKPGSKQQNHVDQSIDGAVYENMDKYKQSGEETNIIRKYPEDAVEYACVVFKNKTLDSKAANH